MDAKENFELVWSDEYAIGHPTIDAQHERMFGVYNQLVEAFNQCRGHLVIESALKDLMAYVKIHFRDEEQLMERLGYKDLKAHVRKHKHLVVELETLIDEHDEGKPVLFYEVLSFSRRLLLEHFLGEDLELKTLMDTWSDSQRSVA